MKEVLFIVSTTSNQWECSRLPSGSLRGHSRLLCYKWHRFDRPLLRAHGYGANRTV